MNRIKWRFYGIAVPLLTALLLCAPVGLAQAPSAADELVERARNAGIDAERIEELRNRISERGLGEEPFVRMLTPAVALAEQDMPSEVIFQKAFEGMAKNVPPARLTPLLEQIRSGTEQVRPHIEEWMGHPDVDAMLQRGEERFDREAFRREMLRVGSMASAGVTGPELVREILSTMTEQGVLRTARPSQALAAVRVAGDIPGASERPGEARQVIVRAMQSGFSADELQRLPGAMNMAMRRSQLPAAAVMEGTGRQLERGIPASDVLQNLFNGQVGAGPPGQRPGGLENRPGRAPQGGRPDGAGPP